MKKDLENIVGKGEIAGNHWAFSPFLKMLSTLSNMEIISLTAFKLLSANAFNLFGPKILLFRLKYNKPSNKLRNCGKSLLLQNI